MKSQWPEHWKIETLEKSLDALIDYRGKTPTKTDSGIPLITAKIVKNGAILPPSEFIAPEDYEQWMVRGLPEIGDVVITTEAPLGEVAQLSSENVALAQRIVTLRGKKGFLNNDFLLYLLQSSYMQKQLEARASGSTVKGIKQKELRKIELLIPPYDEQIKIACILKSIDLKIQINQQINATLEAMAQALFKSWFVDFEPVKAKIAAKAAGADAEDMTLAAMEALSGQNAEALAKMAQTEPDRYAELKATAELFPDALVDSELGEIPLGWEISTIDQVCHFQNGYAFKSKEMVKEETDAYKVFKMGHIKKGGGLNKAGTKDYYPKIKATKLDRYLIKKGDLLMCMTDMKNNVALLGHTALMDESNAYLLNQRVGLLRSKNNKIVDFPFLYILTNLDGFITDLRSRANSGVQVNLATSEIKATQLVLPTEQIHLAFHKLVFPMYEMIFELEQQNENLESLRDTLLPKLLSGEVSVADV